jgi:hypothetical protein
MIFCHYYMLLFVCILDDVGWTIPIETKYGMLLIANEIKIQANNNSMDIILRLEKEAKSIL